MEKVGRANNIGSILRDDETDLIWDSIYNICILYSYKNSRWMNENSVSKNFVTLKILVLQIPMLA